PAFTNGPLKNKSGITNNNKGFTFIADNSMNRLVRLLTRSTDENRRWIHRSGLQRRSRPTRGLLRSARASVTGTSRTQPHGGLRRVLNTRSRRTENYR